MTFAQPVNIHATSTIFPLQDKEEMIRDIYDWTRSQKRKVFYTHGILIQQEGCNA